MEAIFLETIPWNALARHGSYSIISDQYNGLDSDRKILVACSGQVNRKGIPALTDPSVCLPYTHLN